MLYYYVYFIYFMKKILITLNILLIFAIISCIKKENTKTDNNYIDGDKGIEKAIDFIALQEGFTLTTKNGELGYYSKFCYNKYAKKVGVNNMDKIFITEKQANDCLYEDTKMLYVELLNLMTKHNIKLKNNQYASLTSLCYNIKGNVKAFAKSKLFQAIKNNDKKKIYQEWVQKGWNKTEGVFAQGLKNRRIAEYELFMIN